MNNYWIELATKDSLKSQFRTLLEEVRLALHEVDVQQESASFLPLADTLIEFAQFSRGYFNFFPENNRPQTEQFQALEKIQREWLTIQPLLEQRLQPHLRDQLRIADDIANDCVQLGGVRIKSPSQVCLTYFEKAYTMSRFVYLRAPGLSIPLAGARDPWLWMGLGHEMGHYHYWNQPGLNSDLQAAALKNLSNVLFNASPPLLSLDAATEQLALWHAWLEETFADIFGALIFGPAYIESLILWLRRGNTAETILLNDGDHPLPLLRPLIQIEALKHRAISKEETPLAELDSIQNNWLQFWTESNQLPNQDWQEIVIGKSQVKDCQVVMPHLVGTIVDTLTKLSDKFYSANWHAAITNAARELAAGQQPTTTLPNKATVLPTAWYAWKHVISDSETTASAEERLQALRDWVKAKTVSGGSAQSLKPSVTERLQNALYLQPSDWPGSQPNESFEELKGLETDAGRIATSLLKQDFSTTEEQLTNVWAHSHTSAFSHVHYHRA